MYRFSSQDAYSFVRNIDYHPLTVTDLSPPEFDVTNNRRIELLQEEEKERLFTSARHFLMKRKGAIDAIFNILAKMIVNFDNIEAVDERDLKRVRTKIIKYRGVLNHLESIGIEIQMEDKLEKMIGHVQQERARAKLMNLFVNQSYLRYGEEVEDIESAGGDCLGEEIKIEDVVNEHDRDRGVERVDGGLLDNTDDHKEEVSKEGNENEKEESDSANRDDAESAGGDCLGDGIKMEDMIDDHGRVGEVLMGSTEGDSKCEFNEERNTNEKEEPESAASDDEFVVDDEEDEEEEDHFVLYGMIRCS